MSVIDTSSKRIAPAALPSIKLVDGVPWLTFTYSTKGGTSTYTVRVDVDTVKTSDLSQEFRKANCLYPSADGPEEEYKGTRLEFERECNEQGWKLAYLNPTFSGSKKGVLQRAVVSLRNTTLEQRSRRAKRQERATKGTFERPTRIPSVAVISFGSFQPYLSNSKGLLEFESFVQGRSKRIRIKYDIEHIDVDSLPLDFKKANCVYPRSFLGGDENEPEHWKCMGVRQSEESYLNEIGWKLCFLNQSLIGGRRLLLQQALDAYRRRF
ncbi:MAG: hypothetical protein J3Q66DRAFT_278978, partial [Benniella sp.]